MNISLIEGGSIGGLLE